MKNGTHKNINVQFFVLIFTVLLIQSIGRYYSRHLRIGNYFYLSWIILRFFIPIITIYYLKIPFNRLGFLIPKISKKMLKRIIIAFILLVIGMITVFFIDSYFYFYSSSFRSINDNSQLNNFLVFTISTLPGWEFLHRSFLLMGSFYLLRKRYLINENLATIISISIVMVFEVNYHFIKPPVEAFAMLIGSPILSYIAIKTRSILIPFLIHAIVELAFVFSLISH